MGTQKTFRGASLGTAAALTAFGLSFVGGSVAFAHSSIAATSNEAGSYSTLTFDIPHGCGDSATTEVVIEIPEGINSVTPTRNPLYTLETTIEPLDTPVADGHGGEITERVSKVTYTTDDPLPADQRDTFDVVMKLPEDAAGEMLYFPVTQTCEEGEIAWAEIPEEGQDPHELAHPAPGLHIVEGHGHHHHHGHGDDEGHDHDHGHDHGDDEGHGHDHGDADEAAGDDAEQVEATSAESNSSSATPLAITALIVGGLGLILGAAGLFRGRKA